MRKNTRTKPTNGALNNLNNEQLEMHAQVRILELKARYWKAMHDIKKYTLEDDKLTGEYQAWTEKQQKMNQEIREQYLKQMEENLSKGAMTKHTLTEEDLANNPDLAEEGFKVGDEIEIPELAIEDHTVMGDPSEV